MDTELQQIAKITMNVWSGRPSPNTMYFIVIFIQYVSKCDQTLCTY